MKIINQEKKGKAHREGKNVKREKKNS